MIKEDLRFIADTVKARYGADGLRTLRAIINGKLSTRTLTPEDREKMQAAKAAKKGGK